MKLFEPHRHTFADPSLSGAEGIVDMSDDVRVERLLEAYSHGIFPWPHQELPTLWFCPEPRGVLDFSELHVSRSLTKTMARGHFSFTFDRAFPLVVEACAKVPRPDQSDTWITSRLQKAYLEFHKAGYAHSLEVWQAGDLVGGLYGVYVGGLFCGESMFHVKPDASKCAVVTLVNYLNKNGLLWMDIQMVTPVLGGFGGKYIPRQTFLERLKLCQTQAKALDFKI